MRILIWSHVPPAATSGYWLWLKAGMEAAGHQVIALDALALASLYGPVGMQRVILHYARAYAVDAALVVPSNIVEPALLQGLRQLGCALIGLRYDDAIYVGPGLPLKAMGVLRGLTGLDAGCDVVVTVCQRAVTLFGELGLPIPHYLPVPYPYPLISAEPLPQEPVIRLSGSARYVAGAPDNWRISVARALLAADLPVELCHDSWAQVPGLQAFARPTPTLAGFFHGLRTATVNVSLPSDYLPQPVPGVRLLHLETAAAGGMQVTSPAVELDDYFVADTDIAYADSVNGFVTQARHYLAHPDSARQLGQSSRKALARVGGWDVWWTRVGELLAAKGITLDLAAPHRPPRPDMVLTLSLVAASLAHLHEAAGDMDTAATYFDELLVYDPNDYAGLTGKARLTTDPEAARPYWLQAFSGMASTRELVTPALFGSQAFLTGTDFASESASHCLLIAMETARYDEVITILTKLSPTNVAIAHTMALQLLEHKQGSHCVQALDLAIQHWPEDTRSLRLRAKIHLHYGRVAEADADDARADAFESAARAGV